MKIYFAGGSGSKKREIIWFNFIYRRLLSFYEIYYDKSDQHYQQGSFEMIKEQDANNSN